jgi:hypothetical protein
MIMAIYATLGAVPLAGCAPAGGAPSLISFGIWSSVVHGAVMTVQAVQNPNHIHHLYGDVLALYAAAGTLAYLCPAAVAPFRKGIA